MLKIYREENEAEIGVVKVLIRHIAISTGNKKKA
jgi:hypothetical protein